MQPGTPCPPMEGAKGRIPGKHSTLRTPEALSPHHLCKYSFLPSLVLTKNWGSFKAVSQINRFTTAATEHSGNLFFLYLWGFYRGFLLRGVVISQAVSNSQDLSGTTRTTSSLAWLFFSIQFYFLPSLSPPSFLLFLFLLPPRHQAFLFLFFF